MIFNKGKTLWGTKTRKRSVYAKKSVREKSGKAKQSNTRMLLRDSLADEPSSALKARLLLNDSLDVVKERF